MARWSVLRRPLRARFSLRTLLLLVPVVALFAASVASELHEFRREQAAWSELSALGARRSGMSSKRRQWGARLLGPLLTDMDRTTGVRLGFYTPRQLSPAELERSLELLRSVPRLRELSLRGLPITSAQLQQLSGFPELTHLDLQDTAISDAGLETLDEIPSLVYVTLAGTTVTDAGLRRLANPARARYWLYLRATDELQAAAVDVSPVAKAPHALDANPGEYPAIPAPDSLYVRGPLAESALMRLQGLGCAKSVQRVQIDARISADQLRSFADWRAIEDFALHDVADPLAKFDLSFASGWANLTHLSHLNARIDAEAVRALANCRVLTTIYFSSHSFDDEALEALVEQHPALTRLQLAGCPLTDRALVAIATLPSLGSLSVGSRSITDAGLASLADHPTLEFIHTDWTRYRPETRARFGERAQ